MQIIYQDDRVLVCVKPPRVLSTDEPGGLAELLRQELGCPDMGLRTVHRLDRVVSGLMVLACTKRAAGDLSQQIREGLFEKEYLAVCHGVPPVSAGSMRDLLGRDAATHTTHVAETTGKDVREAVLDYETLAVYNDMSLVKIRLVTGRTHQIRVQFASRGFPLIGDHKYGSKDEATAPMLFSCCLTFPWKGSEMRFEKLPDWI